MITFHKRPDPFTLEIKRDDVSIGFLLWHTGREPMVSIHDTKSGYLTIKEIEQVLVKWQQLFPPKLPATAPVPGTPSVSATAHFDNTLPGATPVLPPPPNEPERVVGPAVPETPEAQAGGGIHPGDLQR